MLARTLTFSPADEDLLLQLPPSAAVFALRSDGEPYISKTANLRRRLQRLLGTPSEHSKRLNLRDRVREIEFTATGSDFESQFLLYKLLRQNFPKTYVARLRLRPAPLIKLHLENEHPRVSVTTRLGKLQAGDSGRAPENGGEDGSNVRFGNVYYGPFPSRALAEKFVSDALDFFKMRRCVEDLHPDPTFPGCVYSEMNMCLAPCFKGCTDDEYQAEVTRVQDFFETGGESFLGELSSQRDRASADLQFEEAAALHAKIEKLKPVLAQLPEIVRRIDRLDALIVQPSAEADSINLFRFHGAQLAGPVNFCLAQNSTSQLPAGLSSQENKPRTMESRVEEAIATCPRPENCSAKEAAEHLAILKRWYYRSHRLGEIFFSDDKGTWPLRRIARAIGRVYKGETADQVFATQPQEQDRNRLP